MSDLFIIFDCIYSFFFIKRSKRQTDKEVNFYFE